MQLRVTLIAAALIVLYRAGARAEVVQLVDNTQLSGKIVHFYDGNFAVETTNGQKSSADRQDQVDHLQAAAGARRVLVAGEDLRPLQGRARQERHAEPHRLLRAHVPGRDGRRR